MPASHEPQQPPSPPNRLPSPSRWRALDMAPGPRNLTSKPDSGGPGSVSWGVGSGDIHGTENGTSHITLHQPDTPMLFASLCPNAGKGAGPDSSPAECPTTPAPHNTSRGDRSSQQPGPQSAAPPPRRALAPVRGNLTSGT